MFTRQEPLHKQVESYIRSKIVSGEFCSGMKIPSTGTLAKETGTSICTVHAALSRLTHEGLLKSEPRRGIYVRGEKPRITRTGIYFSDSLGKPDRGFYIALSERIVKFLNERGIDTEIWTDHRPDHERGEVHPEVKRALQKRQIHGLIVPMINMQIRGWVLDLAKQIPLSLLTTDPTVKYAYREKEQVPSPVLGVRELKKQGCKKIGLISHLMLKGDPRAKVYNVGFYESFLEEVAKYGLETRDEWIRVPDALVSSNTEFGYHAMHEIWNSQERPDGIVVYPDGAAQGAIMAVMERDIRVPDELKLAMHANDRVPYPCPLKATLIMASVDAYAKGLIEVMMAQAEGREIPTFPATTRIIQTNGSAYRA